MDNSQAAVVIERGSASSHPAVATLRINRPERRNALTAEVKHGLADAVPALMSDPGVKCIVLTGTAGSFCSGGDIANMAERDGPSVRRRMEASHRWVSLVFGGKTPVIAAVNGPAAGAGFSLAMLCDIVLVSDTAYFRPGFPAIGAVPDLGLALTLPRAIGMARARELLLTNRRVGAAEAVTLGIAARACPPATLLEEAMTAAIAIASGPRVALGLTKELLAAAFHGVDDFLEKEAAAQAEAFGSSDFAEGVSAFLCKRSPVFGG